MSDPRLRRQPVFNIPFVLIAVLASLAGLQAVREVLPEAGELALFTHLAFVPARLAFAFDPHAVVEALTRLAQGDDGADRLEAARFFLGGGASRPWTLVTYGLLHANWTHLGLNAVWLLAFGAPLARRFGALRFLLFLACGTLGGALTHFALFPLGFEPLVGISAGVSACMGAALRFVFRPPREPLVAPAGIDEATFAARRPAISLRALMRDRRAIAFLLVWLVTNLVTGLGPVATALAGGPIAWQAHVGGFVLGLFGFALFDPPAVAPAPQEEATPETTT